MAGYGMAGTARRGNVWYGMARPGAEWACVAGMELPRKKVNMTNYKWKTPGFYKVSAQAAGEELERIKTANGELTANGIVDASRPKTAILHSIFSWNDTEAAEKWREQQARNMTDNLVTVCVIGSTREQVPVRAFVHLQNDYKPISVVTSSEDLTDQMLRNAMRELKSFEFKYKTLTQLAKVMEAIDKLEIEGAKK